MKRVYKFTIICCLMAGGFSAKAQLDLGTLLESGANDASTYMQSYMEPLFRGLGFGMNGGWYNTAKPHKTLGFDLSITMMATRVPKANEFFTFNNADYENFYYAGGSNVQVPTMFGPNLGADDLPQLSVRDFTDADGDGDLMDELIRFSAPTGLGLTEGELGDILPFNAVPVPMVQLGVGVIKNTDLKLRYIPRQNVGDDANIEMFGLGVMHDITQWLPGEKILPVEISVFGGYTGLRTEIFIDKDAGQSMQLESRSFIGQAIVSKKILVFTPYVGLGFASSKSDITLKGRFETENDVLVDPVNFNYEDSGFRANIGLMVKLAFLTLTGEYAIQEYDTYSVGLGFSFR